MKIKYLLMLICCIPLILIALFGCNNDENVWTGSAVIEGMLITDPNPDNALTLMDWDDFTNENTDEIINQTENTVAQSPSISITGTSMFKPGFFIGDGFTWIENEQREGDRMTMNYLFFDDGTVRRMPSMALSPHDVMNTLINSSPGDVVWDAGMFFHIGFGEYSIDGDTISGYTATTGARIDFHGSFNEFSINILAESPDGTITEIILYTIGDQDPLPAPIFSPLAGTTWSAYLTETSIAETSYLYVYEDFGFLNDGRFYRVRYADYDISEHGPVYILSAQIGSYEVKDNIIIIHSVMYMYTDISSDYMDVYPFPPFSMEFNMTDSTLYLIPFMVAMPEFNVYIPDSFSWMPPRENWVEIFSTELGY
jgi:hypothetical protein